MSTAYRFTVADLERMNPRPLDDTRYEIIDGELHVSTQPHRHHQFTTVRIAYRLVDRDMRAGDGVTLSAPGIVFSEDDAVAPDVIWFASRVEYELAVGPDDKLQRAPTLVVEVLSPGRENERRDLEVKLVTYGRYGVQEYWIADWRDRTARVFRRDGAELRLAATLGAEDTLTSPLVPGFSVAVRELFPP